MGYKEVYASLQEIFPQVDFRILKAVAIEHANDVDAAAESILLEVLPSITGSCEASCTLQDKDAMKHPSSAVGKDKQPMLFGLQEVEEGRRYNLGQEPVACETTVSNGYTSSHVMSTCIGEADPRDLEVGIVDYSKGLECPTSHYNFFKELNTTQTALEPNFMERGINLISNIENITLHGKSHVHDELVDVAPCNSSSQVNVGLVSPGSTHDDRPLGQNDVRSFIGESENVINELHDSAQIDSSAVASVVGCDVQNVPVEPFERNSDDLGNKMIMKDGSFSIYGSEEQSGWSFQPAIAQCLYELEANTVSAGAISGEDFKDFGEAAGSWGCGINQVTTTTAECEELHSKLVDESIADLSFERGILSANDDNLPATLLARSGHFVNIDYLEDLISDAKSNKKKMLSAMELITERMKELEHLKERNKKAQEESSCAGLDTLTKVEELKKILKDTKEANDMHAGEVYGEKAILATEARELQSRLHSLSDERDKSLSLIDEIHQALEARIAAVEEEIVAAEQEKLKKEELARKSLSEQEATVASIVEESKKLQEEAGANSKLREFLMDRGSIVDALQGEIAIICEDVMSLKERVDGRVPLGRSFCSMTSSLVASSSSSYLCRTRHSSEEVLQHEDFTMTPAITGNEQHEVQQPENSNDIHGASADDGWEILKGGVSC
ncbi:uncharacterized protein LOC103978893 [Musa acuminata AAA Group]|uniref:uncharacterized protein LOC103978893 n=1 Tax=Musa acuminata AAA Group TaxID=214697 RepID=UPI0031D2412F